ncbi:uroporphyrinogen decarboxylase [Aquimarina sp. 2-A2]
MDELLFTELVGYFASAMVLASFLMRNIKKLRLVNSVGCLAFIVYGVLLNWSIPIILTNSAIVCVNIYYLFIKKQ